ncbi:hypothetical protein BUALT_Bualt03G0117200 [Buddleja alternifolia]|uniref:Ataxin 2 SM domain-containing protein n=1 Tax=Buddleja alternifolia TaxID=168488 RepID=A0AAV6Y1D9_9LAMI|nr:hypothetical protein BUALT_Bualt03G0117200 [Buddleja alternifolia]
MACRKGHLRGEGRNRNAAAAAAATAVPSVAVSDALLFTMMCIIGLPVDIHAKDGSVYSGIFHTASFDKDYAIVLKKARMIEKGNQEANVVNGNFIETLIIRSQDLVQVVAKAVPLPSDGITGYVKGDGLEATASRSECLNREAEVIKTDKSKGHRKDKSRTRFSARRENNFPYSSTTNTVNLLDDSSEVHNERLHTTKIEEAHKLSVDGRQVQDGSEVKKSNSHNNPEFQDERTMNQVQGSNPTIASCQAQSTTAVNILEEANRKQTPKGVSYGQVRPTLDETACTVVSPPNVSVASIPTVDVNSESSLSASSNSFLLVPPKGSSFNRTAKESKLNPGAKIFYPSMLHHRTVTPPAVPNGASVSYMPGTYTVPPITNAQEEIDASSFARSSMPVKFVQYSNMAIANGGNDAPYVQPRHNWLNLSTTGVIIVTEKLGNICFDKIIGQVINRTQPVRYAGQYHNFQTGPAYVHPNPQNVMLGRVGPLVCMHPISSDVVQSAVGFSPATARPHLNPHQVHFSKHQGNASAQAVQLCLTPPIIANGPQPFVMPSSSPISQPLFPVLRPIPVPGSNGYLSTKFA